MWWESDSEWPATMSSGRDVTTTEVDNPGSRRGERRLRTIDAGCHASRKWFLVARRSVGRAGRAVPSVGQVQNKRIGTDEVVAWLARSLAHRMLDLQS